MPCYNPTAQERLETEEIREKFRADELDKVTKLLCMAGQCSLLGKPYPLELMVWWESHRRWDAIEGRPWQESDLQHYAKDIAYYDKFPSKDSK